MPTHNRKEMLQRALEGMANQSYPEHLYEVVVVDDGSTDGTAEFLAQFSLPHLRLRHVSGEQKGPAAARNLGIQHAHGEVILITGDDCIPDADLLLHHGRRHQAEADIAVLGYVDWHPEANLSPLMHLLSHHVQTGYPLIEDSERVAPQFFYTSNVSVKKEHLLRTSGFDEDFKWAAYEDVELGMRLARLGVRLVLERAAITYHHHEHDWQSIAGRQRVVGRAAVVFARKYPEIGSRLRFDDLANPEFFERFAYSLIQYWFLEGVAQEMSGQTACSLEDSELQLDFPSWLNSTTARWMTRLLERTRSAESDVKLFREQVARRDAAIRQRDTAIQQRDAAIQQRDTAIRERNATIREQNAALRHRDEWIRQRDERILSYEEHVCRLRAELEGLEAFTRKVRGSLLYRTLTAIKRLLRAGR
jgi:glycosyltransferase involved in cell wall biosynthesis